MYFEVETTSKQNLCRNYFEVEVGAESKKNLHNSHSARHIYFKNTVSLVVIISYLHILHKTIHLIMMMITMYTQCILLINKIDVKQKVNVN